MVDSENPKSEEDTQPELGVALNATDGLRNMLKAMIPVVNIVQNSQIKAISATFAKSAAAVFEQANQVSSAALAAQAAGALDLARLNRQLAEITRVWEKAYLPQLREVARSLSIAALPPNLRELPGLSPLDLIEVGRTEGLALYGVPGPATAATILKAQSPDERRAVLDRELGNIATECEVSLRGDLQTRSEPHKFLLSKACAAARDGHVEAAQTLATTVLDASLTLFDAETRRLMKRSYGKKRDEDTLMVREAMIVLPTMTAYTSFDPHGDGAVPETYSRHATAHTASPRQFTRGNAAKALLLATSVLNSVGETTADEVLAG